VAYLVIPLKSRPNSPPLPTLHAEVRTAPFQRSSSWIPGINTTLKKKTQFWKAKTRKSMNLRRGFPLLWQQYAALLKKNLLLSWRNKTATFMQLFSSLFFIFLIFSIQKAIEARYATSTAYKSVTDPKALLLPPIPPCEDKFYTKLPCFDLLWSGNASATVRKIVTNIMANNPGRPIPESKVGASVWLLSC
jgi:hypothetical protein